MDFYILILIKPDIILVKFEIKRKYRKNIKTQNVGEVVYMVNDHWSPLCGTYLR